MSRLLPAFFNPVFNYVKILQCLPHQKKAFHSIIYLEHMYVFIKKEKVKMC